jgi:hypothetical protein
MPGKTQAELVAKMFALPALTPPPRIAIDCQTQPTMTSALRYVFDLDMSSTASAVSTDLCPPGAGFLALSRSPFHALSYVKYLATSKNMTVLFPQPLGSVGFGVSQRIISTGGTARLYPLQPEYLVGQTNIGAQSDVLYSWSDHGRRWLWMDAADIMSFTSTGTTVAGTETITVFAWDMSGPEAITDIQWSNPLYSPGVAGWYAFECAITGAGTYQFGITQTKPAGMVTIWEGLPSLASQNSSVSRIRILGASLMLSCRASALNAAGTVGGFVVPSGEDILSYLTMNKDPINNLSALPQGAEFPLAKGLHAIHKPDGADCLKFHAAFNQTSSVYDGTTVMRPSPEGGYVVIGYLGPATSTNTYAGNSFLISAFFGVETTQLTQWGTSLPPTIKSSELESALMILAHVPTFHENPVHIAAILSALKSAGAVAIRWAPTILAAIEARVATATPDASPRDYRDTPSKTYTSPRS